MDEKGAFSRAVYRNRFDSWNNTLAAAGLNQLTQGTKVLRGDLLRELRRLADELDRPPKSTEMEEHNKYSQGVYNRRFGSWEEALEACGLDFQRNDRKGPVRLIYRNCNI